MIASSDSFAPETAAALAADLEQMRTANYCLRTALDQISEGVLILAPEAADALGPRVLFSNAAAALMAGVTPERGLRDLALTELTAGDADACGLLEALGRAVTNGGVDECEGGLQHFQGRDALRCRWRLRAVHDRQRRLLNHTVVLTPVVAAGEDLAGQSEQLKQDHLATLAQGIVHDVNNLLGPAVMRLSDLLQQVQDQPALSEQLQLIFNGLKRARQFTSQVVTVCKAKPNPGRPVDLSAIIRETVQVAGAGANVEMRVRLQPGLRWPVADAVRVSQVLQNLILNGIQAMPQGGFMDIEAANLDIQPGQDEVLKPGPHVRVVVRDRGCGIAPENMARLFREAFSTKTDGNGLGLTTCRRFIRALGGDLRAESRLHAGTEFSVLLPAVAAPEGPAAAAHDPAPVPLKTGRGRVLIVDDEEDLRKVAHAILKRCGYEVAECDNGQDAIRLYQSLARQGLTPDVVLMDLTLRGGMNGAETAAAILRLDPRARLVVTSGSVNGEVQMSYLEKGFAAVLPKPYEAGELTQLVHRIIASRPSAQPADRRA